MNITMRNIPEDVVSKLRTLATRERRSLNSEMLCLLEKGVDADAIRLVEEKRGIALDMQLDAWKRICGEWEDERSTEQIVADVLDARTMGREFDS